jgi:acetolactate decarboxylase
MVMVIKIRKTFFWIGVALICVIAPLACVFTAFAADGTTVQRGDRTALYAYGTIEGLRAGVYDGELTIGQLSTHGNFGLGTFNRLDGELVMLRGVTYHVKADGSVSEADAADRTPLAYVLPFKPSRRIELDALQTGQPGTGAPGAAASVASPPSLADIERLIDARLPNKNAFHAALVSGSFAKVSTRAVAPQVRPYRPFAVVSQEQVVFNRDAISGSLVGIRSPAFAKGISPAGWHWHFISHDARFGGHVLSASIGKGTIELAAVQEFDVELPATDDFANADLSGAQ